MSQGESKFLNPVLKLTDDSLSWAGKSFRFINANSVFWVSFGSKLKSEDKEYAISQARLIRRDQSKLVPICIFLMHVDLQKGPITSYGPSLSVQRGLWKQSEALFSV